MIMSGQLLDKLTHSTCFNVHAFGQYVIVKARLKMFLLSNVCRAMFYRLVKVLF